MVQYKDQKSGRRHVKNQEGVPIINQELATKDPQLSGIMKHTNQKSGISKAISLNIRNQESNHPLYTPFWENVFTSMTMSATKIWCEAVRWLVFSKNSTWWVIMGLVYENNTSGISDYVNFIVHENSTLEISNAFYLLFTPWHMI